MVMKNYEKHIVNLSEEIRELILKYMVKNILGENTTTDLINLVISANLSCSFYLMLLLADENPEIVEKVKRFTNFLTESLKTFLSPEKVKIFTEPE